MTAGAVVPDMMVARAAQKAGLDIDPASAEEAMALLHKIAGYSAELLVKAREAMER